MKFNDKDTKQPDKIELSLKLADEFCANNKDLIFCVDNETFYLWSDNYYQLRKDKQVKLYLIHNEAYAYLSVNGFKNFMNNIAVLSQVNLSDFNSYEIMDFCNGVLDIKTGVFNGHDRKYLSTTRIPYNYDQKADCPVWHGFLQTALEGDMERISVLQEFMGYCLGRDNSFHRALVLIGEGRNGKGTTFHVINRMLGKANCSALKLGEMNRQESVSQLVGKLVNIDADTDTSASGFESDFRRISAGDAIMARELYNNPFMFTPYCKLIIGANDLPRIADKTHGFYDRLIIIPYNVSFVGREDLQLKDKLDAEIAGILNWALEGRKRLYERGRFEIAKTLDDYVVDLKRENNPVDLYIYENIGFHDDAKTSKREVYEHYHQWAKESGHQPCSKIKFGKEFFRLCKSKISKDEREDGMERTPIWTNVFIKGKFDPSLNTGKGDQVRWDE